MMSWEPKPWKPIAAMLGAILLVWAAVALTGSRYIVTGSDRAAYIVDSYTGDVKICFASGKCRMAIIEPESK